MPKTIDLPKGVYAVGNHGYTSSYRSKYLGYFRTIDDALAAYAAAVEADPIIYNPSPPYLVDEDVREVVGSVRWKRHKRGSKYLKGRAGGKDEYMHRFVWRLYGGVEPQPGQDIDHINRDPSDNRRCNLRLMTHRGNSLNNAGSCAYETKFGTWLVLVSADRPDRFCKTYKDEEIARLVVKHLKAKWIEQETISTLEEVSR